MLGELNESEILIEEVTETVNEMSSGKAQVLNGFPVQFLQKCDMSVFEWL